MSDKLKYLVKWGSSEKEECKCTSKSEALLVASAVLNTNNEVTIKTL